MYRLREAVGRIGQWLANLGAALVSPIERLFQFIGGKFFAASERLNDVDSVLLTVGRIVLWPIRALWHVAAAVGSMLLPESARRALVAPWVKLWRLAIGFGAGLWRLAERLNLDGVMLWIAWLTKPVWRPIAGLGGFAYAWLATRHYKALLWGLPAAVLLLPIVGAAAWGLVWGKASASERYKVALRDAVDQRDYARMMLLESKLAQLGADTRHADFKTAEALAEEGKLDEAYERMQRLAPEGRASFAPAHAWVLQRLLSGKLNVPEQDRLRLAGLHLEHLSHLGIKGPELEFLRGVWEGQNNQLAAASKTLSPLIGRMPNAALERLRIDMALGNFEEARRDAFAVRGHLEDAKRRGEKVEVQQLQALVIAEELLGDAEAQAAAIRQWHAAAPDDPAAKRSVAMLDVRQFNQMVRMPNADPRELADQIVEMVEMASNPTEYQPQLLQLFGQRKQAPILEALIQELITSPQTPLAVVDALGTAAALQGEVELARTLLKRVVDQQPENAVAWNNYGWALMQEPAKNLDAAREAVNNALMIMPNEFRFRETRGQLNVQLQRWQEAVEDLEFALNGMPEARPVHASLAVAYDQLGQSELAAMHRERAQ